MKLFLTIAILISILGKPAAQQAYIYRVFDSYFRENPFDAGFSDFYKKLSSDPALSNKSIHKRTDSTLFVFTGSYPNFKKGNSNFTRADIRLEEIEIEISDSLHIRDTLLQYQIICYCTTGKPGSNAAKNLYDNFHKEYRLVFTDRETKENDENAGAIRNYFSSNLPISPLTTVWSRVNENESAFSVAVRMKLKQNTLDLFKLSDLLHDP